MTSAVYHGRKATNQTYLFADYKSIESLEFISELQSKRNQAKKWQILSTTYFQKEIVLSKFPLLINNSGPFIVLHGIIKDIDFPENIATFAVRNIDFYHHFPVRSK